MFGNNFDDGDEEASENNTGYSFIREPEGDTTPTASDVEDEGVPGRWKLGNHDVNTGLDATDLEEAARKADGVNNSMAETLRAAAGMVGGDSVNGFECPVCGINHSHEDYKHDIRASTDATPTGGFEVTEAFADEMQYNPYCHCGANELAMLVRFFHHIGVPMFDDQLEFEGVLEAEEDALWDAYSLWNTERDMTVQTAANRKNIDTTLVEELTKFFRRVSSIESAADSAPIASETQSAIEETRRSIIDALSE